MAGRKKGPIIQYFTHYARMDNIQEHCMDRPYAQEALLEASRKV